MKERRFTNKKLIALMLPLAVDQLLNSFMGTVDTLVVSNLGSAAISAVSLVDSINILVVQAFFALASGGTVVCSHYLGCEKKERATNAARQLVFITFAMSLIIANALAIIVAAEDPATPKWKIHTNTRFNTTLIPFAINEICIGSLLFSCALKMQAPSSYNAING